jgi:hypothetical protein
MLSDAVGTASGLHNPVVDVGTPSPNTQQDWVKTKVYFHGFDDVPSTTELLKSPSFYCLGHEWALDLYPRGNKRDENIFLEGSMGLYLAHHSNGKIEIEYGFAFVDFIETPNMNTIYAFSDRDSYGCPACIEHEKALLLLVNGALVIEVRMKLVKTATPFIPENPSTRLTAKEFFNDQEYADVIFEIKWGLLKKTATKFYAHRMFLKKAAPQLAELSLSVEPPSVIELPNISPQTFNDLLLYIYGCKIPGFGKDISHTKEIIEVADKYGVTTLKLEAEALYVSSLTMTLENMMEHFTFAEAKNCAYLKEKAIDFIISNSAEVMKQKKLTNVDGGPSMSDIIAAVARGQAVKSIEKEFCTMSINELRHNAHAKDVEVDGSREMLISALEGSKAEEEEEGDEDE